MAFRDRRHPFAIPCLPLVRSLACSLPPRIEEEGKGPPSPKLHLHFFPKSIFGAVNKAFSGGCSGLLGPWVRVTGFEIEMQRLNQSPWTTSSSFPSISMRKK